MFLVFFVDVVFCYFVLYEWVYCFILDGIWVDEGDLDGEVVEVVWLQLGEQVDLGLGFYLEYFDGVCMVEYVVDGCFFFGDCFELLQFV